MRHLKSTQRDYYGLRTTDYGHRPGFTLVEVLVATVLTLVLLGTLVSALGYITNKVADSRAVVEMNDRLRNVKQLLQSDLLGQTAPTNPPLNPDAGQGYFEIIEGPIGPVYDPNPVNASPSNSIVNNLGTSFNYSVLNRDDDMLGDGDDILMFTTMSTSGNPFVGKWGGGFTTSQFAEIAWFLRGTTLYRRVLLVIPGVDPNTYSYNNRDFYANYDLSMRQEGGQWSPVVVSPTVTQSAWGAGTSTAIVQSNTLGDLTKRENRYAHQPLAYPHDARCWGLVLQGNGGGGGAGAFGSKLKPDPRPGLGLPTLRECSASSAGAMKGGQQNTAWPLPFYEQANGGIPFGATKSRPEYILSPLQSASANPDPKQMLVFPDVGRSTNVGGATQRAQINSFNFGCLNLSWASNNQNGEWDPFGGMGRTQTTGTPVYLTSSGTGISQVNANNALAGAFGTYDGGRVDDVVLTNVLSFDVKVWDPGAPVLQVNAGGTIYSVVPGDPGYRNALATFINAPSAGGQVTIASFGAYVDMNYMQFTAGDPYAYHPLARYVDGPPPYPKPGQTTPTFVGPATRNYEAALQQFESSVMKVQSQHYRPLPRPKFAGPGDRRSLINGILPNLNPATDWPLGTAQIGASWCGSLASVYCTWSTHYESDGIDQDGDGVVDEGTNGIDDPERTPNAGQSGDPANYGRIIHISPPITAGTYHDGIDDAREREAPPPYPHALRGIQVKIRVLETDSKQIREITLVHECLQE